MDFSTRYAKLNPAQQQAVDTIDGPVMVVAGPGTGKTELLSMRAANILRKTDTPPESILCLTFTESGAAAMRQRMVEIIGKDAYKVAVHTFHSFGAEVINQNGDFFYRGANFRPADQLSSYQLLRRIFDGLSHDSLLTSTMNGEYTHLSDTLTAISEIRKAGLSYDELPIILDANEQVISVSQPLLQQAFAARISKATVESLRSLVEPIRTSGGDISLPGMTSLARVLATSLQTAIDTADEIGKTTPVTTWKNTWMRKNQAGELILKSHETQQKLRQVAIVYEQYLLGMQELELYDFDDMILSVVHAMEIFPDLRYNLQEKFQYIMVDEFQDTNMAQMRILHNLTHTEAIDDVPNVMVVGDDDQGIYSFQGAEIGNIVGFTDTYPRTQVITLVDNYRSAEPILTSARAVIVQGQDRLETLMPGIDKTLTAHRNPQGSTVTLIEAASKHDERHHLVQSIAAQIQAGQAPETIAVLARRHHEIISLLPYFAQADITVNYERRDNVLDIAPIVAVEAVATLLVALFEGRHSEVNAQLPELMAHPAWAINPTDVWKLSLAAYNQRTSWMEVMAVTPAFVPLHTWLLAVSQQAPHTPLEHILDTIIGRDTPEGCEFTSPLLNYFFSVDKLAEHPDEYLVYLEALRTIRSKLRDYQPDQVPTLQTLLTFIDLNRRLGTTITSVRPQVNDQQGAVNLMTAHKSKGLEFDTVCVIGAVDTAWGERVRSRSRLISYPENLAHLAPSGDSPSERLRLFFVAMTRARKQLVISYASSDDNGKDALCANFLLATDLTPRRIDDTHDIAELVAGAQQRWYEPLVSLSTGTMAELLAPTLQNYKLSVTHLNNFLDVTRGGPQAFLMNNLLRFPQAMGPAAAYGSAIHATLQHAHSHVAATSERKPIDEILADFEKNLRDQRMTDSDFDTYLTKGGDTLRAFLTAKYDTFATTQKVELNFAGQQVVIDDARLTGSLDLVDIDTSARTMTVTDYKTGKASYGWTGSTDYEKIKLHKYRQQLMFYRLLIEESRDYHNYQVTNGCLQFVEPTRTGDILSLEATFTVDELNRFRDLIGTIWRKIMTLDLPDTSEYSQDYKGMVAFESELLGE